MAPLISVEELERLLGQGTDLVIADCRFSLGDPLAGQKTWQESHIPGSYHVDLERDMSAPRTAKGGRHPLPDAARFATAMSRIGLEPGVLLVTLDDSRGAYASRLWWLARYFGHRAVRVLDGGIGAWTASGLALCADAPVERRTDFCALPDSALWVDFDAVRERAADTVLIDAREARRYAGLEEPIDPVAGHIPGALNRPWGDAIGSDGLFLGPAVQRERWRDCADATQIICYCGSGVTACVNLLSLELAGIHGACLYPGSWSDWCAREQAAVAVCR